MISPLAAFVPIDRRLAGHAFPNRLRGAVLFADISGFTLMTQSLVETFGPRRGSELLTEKLERVYDALITEVHRFRGSVTAFSGDAITVFFDDVTCANAVGCGLALQGVMAGISRTRVAGAAGVEARTGSGQLAIKVGIAAGELRRFIVGDPEVQIFDVLAGRLLDRMAAAEKHARPGEVVVDEATREALGGRLDIAEGRGALGADTRFHVVRALACTVLPSPWPDDDQLQADALRPWVLAPLRQRLESGTRFALAEHRACTALFLQFAGIDFDAADDAGETLDAYIRWVQAVVSSQEGVLVDITTGDKGNYLYVAFGAPVAHKDDAARALSAAAQLVKPPPSASEVRRVRIGINQGRMRVGPFGAVSRMTYGVLGSPVNIAARLMSAAEIGQVLVSDPVARAAQDRFHFDPLPPILLKGIDAPLAVALLRERRSSGARTRHVELPLLGRQRERAVVREALSALLSGERRVLLIEGEAGIGKSRLAAHILDAAREQEIGILWGGGDPLEQRTPLSPWRAVLLQGLGIAELDGSDRAERLLGQLPEQMRENAALLNPLLGLDLLESAALAMLTPQQRAALTQDVIVSLLGRLTWPGARRSELRLLLMDDAHWLDSLSLSLLERAVSRLQPLVCVVTTRPLEEPLPRSLRQIAEAETTRRLMLSALSPNEATELARQRLGIEVLPPEVAELINRRADGNPFFSEELALTLRDSGRIRIENGRCHVLTAGGLTEDTIPATVEGAIVERIDRLPIERQLALKAASVFGRVFSGRGVEEIYPKGEKRGNLAADLESLVALAITVVEVPEPELRYAFKHIIIQQVAYDQLLFQQRRTLHRQAAVWLERLHESDLSPVYGLLVHHWRGAEDLPRTLHYLKLAGDEANRASAFAEAVTFYNEALALLKKLPDLDPHIELEIQIALGTAWMTAKGQGATEVERAYSRARELCQEIGQSEQMIPKTFSVLWGLWRLYFLRAQHRKARELATECLALAERVDVPSLRMVAHHAMGGTALFLGELALAQTHLEQGIALYDPAQHRSLAFRHGHDFGVWCLFYDAWVLWHLGYPEQCMKRSHDALELARRLDHPASLAAALFYMSRTHSLRRDAREVLKYGEAVRTLGRERGFPMWVEIGMIQIGVAMVWQGRGQEGLAHLQEGVASHREKGAQLDQPRMLAALAEAHSSVGETVVGLALLDEVQKTAQKSGELVLQAELHRLRGELLLSLPSPSAAVEASFRESIDVARRQQARALELRAAVSLSRLWQRQDKRQEARALLSDIYGWFTEGFEEPDLRVARELLEELT